MQRRSTPPDTDFKPSPSSDLLLRADNLCSPGLIHQPRLHYTHNDLPPTTRPLIHNTRPTFTDDAVMYFVSRAEQRRLERASLVGRGDLGCLFHYSFRCVLLCKRSRNPGIPAFRRIPVIPFRKVPKSGHILQRNRYDNIPRSGIPEISSLHMP